MTRRKGWNPWNPFPLTLFIRARVCGQTTGIPSKGSKGSNALRLAHSIVCVPSLELWVGTAGFLLSAVAW